MALTYPASDGLTHPAVASSGTASLGWDATTIDFTTGSNDFTSTATEAIGGATFTVGDAANAGTLSTSGTGLQIAPNASITIPNMPRVSVPITDLASGWSADDSDTLWIIYRRTASQAVSGASAVLGLCSGTWDNTNSTSIIQVDTGTQRARGNSTNSDNVSSEDHEVLALRIVGRAVTCYSAQTWAANILTDPEANLTQINGSYPHIFDGGTVSAAGAVTPSHIYIGAARSSGAWTEIGLSLSAVVRGATLS